MFACHSSRLKKAGVMDLLISTPVSLPPSSKTCRSTTAKTTAPLQALQKQVVCEGSFRSALSRAPSATAMALPRQSGVGGEGSGQTGNGLE